MNLDRLLGFGVRQLFGGARRGQPALAAFGAALAILSWLRRRSAEDKLLFSDDLKEGESMQITFRRGTDVIDTATIEG